MSRLTRRFDNEIKIAGCVKKCAECYGMFCQYPKIALEKLAHYEDLEEQGRLHVAPLKDGTPILYVTYDWVEGEQLSEDKYIYGMTENLIGELGQDYWLSLEDLQKAKEEAEAKLIELKGE